MGLFEGVIERYVTKTGSLSGTKSVVRVGALKEEKQMQNIYRNNRNIYRNIYRSGRVVYPADSLTYFGLKWQRISGGKLPFLTCKFVEVDYSCLSLQLGISRV